MPKIVSTPEAMRWLKAADGDVDIVHLLVDRAEIFVENQTGRFFGASGTSHTEHFHGNGTDTLWLNEEADSVTSVEERDKIGDAWVAITEGADDGWELRARMLLRKGGHRWAMGKQYRVIYSFGYVSPPGDIKELVLDLVKLKYDERCLNLAVSSEAIADERYAREAFTGDIMSIPWVRETLGHWRGFRAVG